MRNSASDLVAGSISANTFAIGDALPDPESLGASDALGVRLDTPPANSISTVVSTLTPVVWPIHLQST